MDTMNSTLIPYFVHETLYQKRFGPIYSVLEEDVRLFAQNTKSIDWIGFRVSNMRSQELLFYYAQAHGLAHTHTPAVHVSRAEWMMALTAGHFPSMNVCDVRHDEIPMVYANTRKCQTLAYLSFAALNIAFPLNILGNWTIQIDIHQIELVFICRCVQRQRQKNADAVPFKKSIF